MRLSDIGGEFGWIERMRQAHGGASGLGLTLAIGDDAAVLEQEAGRQLVVTTDMLVEGVHFRRDWSDPYSVGWKSAAVNLSDIAAMGAEPTFAFISIAFPAEETVEFLDRLYDGFVDCLNRYGARLAGGDTNTSPDRLVLSVTQMGTVRTGQALTRGGARVGDALLVTGTLGDSAGGLALLSKHGLARAEKMSLELVQAHRRPQPRIVAAREAARTGKVHAAMDLSDGLAGDLQKLCAASHVGARLETAGLPLSEALCQCAAVLGLNAVDLALDGGEDYELLLAVAPADVEAVRAAMTSTGMPVSQVGEIVKSGLCIVAPNGQDELPTERRGWDHFLR